MATASLEPIKVRTLTFIPREHGATAMLLTPFLAAAILLRRVYWPELVALVAIAFGFAIKDPLVVIARQRLVWRQEHAETKAAMRTALIESLVLAACGVTLLLVREWRPLALLFLTAAAFTALAVMANVRNRQRSTWFQVASAISLSATALVACLAAIGTIPDWCWMLWLLCTLNAVAGIFVVHARLDARIAARKGKTTDHRNRQTAFVCQVVLILTSIVAAWLGRHWIAAGLFFVAVCYLTELQRQKNPESLQLPLKRAGLEALGISTVYALLLVSGLWHG